MNAVHAEASPPPHEIRYEQHTGFIYLVTKGVIDARGAAFILAFCEAHVPPDEPLFFIGDGRKATGMDAEARTVMANLAARRPVYFSGFGAPLPMRVLTTLVLRAVSLVSNRLIGNFASNEEEARAWLTEKRRAYLAGKGST